MIKMNEPADAVVFDGVSKSYSGKRVVNGLSLKIPHGTTFGLLGPNGAGKSTSLKALMGLLTVDEGAIKIFGHDIAAIHGSPEHLTLRQRIGYVSETHSIYRWMKVKQAINFAKKFYPTWNEDLESELVDQFELDRNKKVSQLSKGMLAKLSLLLAIAHEPDLLVLDEPTSGLDAMAREEFLYGILKADTLKERTVIFSSHSIGDVERIADRVGVIRGGTLIVDETVENILAGTKRLQAVLKDDAMPKWVPDSTIWQRVERREWQLTVSDCCPNLVDQLNSSNELENVEVCDLSLEEIFKDYFRSKKATTPETTLEGSINA